MFTFFPPIPIPTYEINYSYADPLSVKYKIIIILIMIIGYILKMIYDSHKNRKS